MVRAELNYGHDVRLISLLLGAILLTGCAGAATTGAEPTTPTTPTTQPTPAMPATPTPEPSASEQPRDCERVMFQRAQGTIRSQQSAFAELDFAAARGYASESFRNGVSVPRFESIIRGRYRFLLDEPTIAFIDCQRLGESALIRVEFEDPPNATTVTMVYRVVLENESWFIDAASISDRRTDVTV